MKDNKYFDAHVTMAVEIEFEDGGRFWTEVKGSELKDYCNKIYERGDYVSDIDFCSKQEDKWVRNVLNHAYYNWFENREWWKARKLTSLNDVVKYIIDNKLVA